MESRKFFYTPENSDEVVSFDSDTETNTAQSPAQKEPKIHTNNMGPEVVNGFRQVALNRFVGLDRPFYTENENKENNKDSSDAFKYYESVLKEDKEKWKTIIEKTPQQKEICRMIIKELPEFLKEYGLEKPVLIPETAIQIFDMSKFGEESRIKEKKFPAHWSTQNQIIRFNGDRIMGMSNLEFASILAHELIHSQSFESLAIHEDVDENGEIKRGAVGRRSGFVNYSLEENKDGKKVVVDNFAQLNEAVTESMAQHFLYKYLYKIPHVESDIEHINKKLREKYNTEKAKNPDMPIHIEDNVTGLSCGDDDFKGGVEGGRQIIIDSGSYWDEIKKFKGAVRGIFAKAQVYQKQYDQAAKPVNKESSLHTLLMSLKNELDVTKFFTRAYFTGQQLDLARLIKFVTGKSFREFGKMTTLYDKRSTEEFKS